MERLDAPQPSFPLPPLATIPNEDVDKADEAKRIMTHFGPANGALPAVMFGAAPFSTIYNSDDHIRGAAPFRTTRLALRYGIRAFDTSPYYGPSEIILGNVLQALAPEFPRSSYQIFTKCGRFGNTREAFDCSAAAVRASVARSLARLHTTYLDAVYVHDVEFVAGTRAPRTAGDHRGALGAEAGAYGLGPGQEVDACAGDSEVLEAVAVLRALQDEGVVRRVGISGYPLPTLLRLALLVRHTPPYRPLDVVLSYCHLNLQNRTLLAFKEALETRAGVTQVIAASPLSMGLLTPNAPAWHPAPGNLKDAIGRVLGVTEKSGGESGLPELALQYAFEKAREVGIPTVVGLGSLKDVHENARIWHDVDKQDLGKNEGWKQRVQQVISVFEESNVLDRSWENPRFHSG